MRIIGVDYGLKRTGIAVWDSGASLFLPLMVIDEDRMDEVVKELADLASTENADKIVIGHPKTLGNESSEQVRLTDEFIEALRRRTDVDIEIEDERLSSGIAGRLQSSGGKKQTASNDALAAAAILESYVRRNRLIESDTDEQNDGFGV